MTDLQTLLEAIDELPAKELKQVKKAVEKREDELLHQPNPSTQEEIEQRIAQMNAALANFREGLTEEEWKKIAHDMNEEYIEPDDPTLFSDNDLPDGQP